MARPTMFQLVAEEEDRTLTFPLPDGEHVVGSDGECAIRLRHPTVSGRHARLVVEEGACAIEDLGSRNGTRVAGRKVAERAAVAPGEEILIGTQTARVEEVEAEDLEPAVRFQTVTGAGEPGTAGRRPTTAATGSLEVFGLHGLPRILDAIDGEAPPAEVAQVVGAALHEALPCLFTRLLAAGGGVLFEASRVEEATVEEVRVENRVATVVVGFAHATQARGFRSLVESGARLVEMAAGRRGPSVPRTRPDDDEPPPLPDPPTVEPEVRRIYRDAARVAQGEISVLISGESGTGKELLARYLHAGSSRREAPFVALNCAALPTDLLEAELFGIEAGVATGVDSRPGKFELADGGTLFLDEIGDMARETQAKILRVLQEGEIFRLGGREARSARVRVIAATNRELGSLLDSGRFREDLYYRIADWAVELPPLRRRRGDIPNLAAYFLSREAEKRGVALAGISKAAMAALTAHDWPGNVRQLEREMARVALFLGDGQMLQEGQLQDAIRGGRVRAAPAVGSLRDRLEALEREILEATLHRHEGNISAASRELGIARSTLYRRIEELGIEPSAGA